MSVNSTCSGQTKNGEVQSKYFVDSKDNTDDSVSEFQEPKKGVKVPQKVKTAPKSKTTKKPTKRSRGQKDIRTALSKKNDLIAFSKDFNAVCKHSGLDVDAEQLQLAIALSKSLQNTEEKPETCSESSQPSTSQERVVKIRRTLQQYGFKVPEVKINVGGTKRGRKTRKESKLLLITEAERQQCIADKYSQVLFDNVVECKVVESESNEGTLYHISTNISYEAIKDNKVFYVKELLDDTTSTIGSLLRDWSKIPGRPLSPVKKSANVKLEKMNFSPGEVDTLLSGSVAKAQDIVKSKKVELKEELDMQDNIIDKDGLHLQEIIKKPITETDNVREIPQTQLRSYSPDLFDDEFSSIDNTKDTISSQRSQNSCSQPNSQKSVPNATRRKTDDFMDLTECVDVFSLPPIARNNNITSTELQIINSASNSQKSDDPMELTECLVANLQTRVAKPKDLNIEDNIDLTQESDDKEEYTIVNVPEDETVINIDENIDLTQSDHSDDTLLPLVYISGQRTGSFHEEVTVFHSDLKLDKSKEESSIKNTGKFIDKYPVNIINSHDEFQQSNSKENNLTSHVTLNKERYSSPLKPSSIFEEFVFEHSDHQSSKDTDAKLSDISDIIQPVPELVEDIDLTQNTDSSIHSSVDEILPTTEHDNSSLGKKDNVSIDYDEVYMNETVENIQIPKSRRDPQETKEDQHNNTLKLSDDISIDYDEVFMNKTKENICSRLPIDEYAEKKNLDRKTLKPNDVLEQKEADRSIQIGMVENTETADIVYDYIDIINDDVLIHTSFEGDKIIYTPTKADQSTSVATPDPSQEVFEISDEELNYSMHKSKHLMSNSQDSQDYNLPDIDHGHFDYGGISILDNISSVEDNGKNSLATSKVNLRKSASESCLQSICVKDTRFKTKSPTKYSKFEATILQRDIYSSVQTPNKTEYLIKTHNVTPMTDYASMTTPDRNKELEKYGLKPFKRKRAIQLLTHVYTQTHPVVENFAEEDQPSPSKKRKQDRPPTQTSSHIPSERTTKKSTTKSPRKCTKSPAKSCASKNYGEDVFEKENVNYDETSSDAVLKDIECSPEDWVFQKREKAKVHSCRVPLHVAFHNYVASRRRLREAILRYEPVNIDVIHKHLAGYGHRYDPKDLLRFLDKKCITVKTADNNGRNNKKS